MARIPPSLDAATPADHTSTVVTIAGVIAALYFGSEILIPLALAVLLSFAMAPFVKALQKLGLGRALPVAIVVVVTFTLLAGLGTLLALQLRDFSSALPRYESTITTKLQSVREITDSGSMRTIEDAITRLSRAVNRGAAGPGPAASAPATTDSGIAAATTPVVAPTRVEIVAPAIGPLDAIVLVSEPLLHPLSIALVVVIFVIFILLQREDLRNRAIRLFGASDLQRTTAAINDGGRRLSRYLLTQVAMNTGAGIIVAVALGAIHVPSPILLGVLFGIARFIPYIGPLLGAVLPVLLATAVDPGWSMVVWTVVILCVIEVVIGQFVEPFAYGHNTGLSPIALVVAATVWTVLWGPVGLFLSTPLTVCLVVLGRHVESLTFLDVLLGDRPALTPAETFYQRMLADDPIEAADQAQQCLTTMSVGQYYDTVALPALLMAQDDAAEGRLDMERLTRIKAAAIEVIDDLAPQAADDTAEPSSVTSLVPSKPAEDRQGRDDRHAPDRVPDRLKPAGSLLCIGGRTPLDDVAAAMLAQACLGQGIGAKAGSFVQLSKSEIDALDVSSVRMIVLSMLDGSSTAFPRFILRRLRQRAPQAEIVVAAWWRRDGRRDTDDAMDAVVRQPKVATILEAIAYCLAARPVADAPAPPAGDAAPTPGPLPLAS